MDRPDKRKTVTYMISAEAYMDHLEDKLDWTQHSAELQVRVRDLEERVFKLSEAIRKHVGYIDD